MKEEKGSDKFISLVFSISGKQITIDKVNLNQPLKVSVQKALDESGSTRPLSDYNVLYEGKIIDISQKVETFHFPDGAILIVSLKTGQGGCNCGTIC